VTTEPVKRVNIKECEGMSATVSVERTNFV
jgi:hypothetical protein